MEISRLRGRGRRGRRTDFEAHLLRQTFLWRFADQAEAEALILAGETLDDGLREAGQSEEESESLTESHLRAAAAELRRLGEYLERVVRERFASPLSRPSSQLFDFIGFIW